jgi:segregation and condensation protein A
MENQDTTDQSLEIKVDGTLLEKLPADLYIPPDALRVFLETFEGPLDLLLYLIKKQNIDVLDIPIAEITRQYMKYIDIMRGLRVELAAEYLVMAAMLAEIKSRMLLPRVVVTENDETDPRAELIRRLQEYECFKKAASDLDILPRLEREIYVAEAQPPALDFSRVQATISLDELLSSLKDVLKRSELHTAHAIIKEPLSVRERMSIVLSTIKSDKFTQFIDLFKKEEGRMGVVVTLIAILELIKRALIEMVQTEPYAPIYVKATTELLEASQ